MLFNASYSQKSSYSDWNWKYHQRKHLTVFWKQSKKGLWKYFWGSLHEGLKLVYSNSYDLVSVQKDFKIFIGKRWRTSVNLSQWITLLKQIVSWEKGTFLPMNSILLLGKSSFMEDRSVTSILIETFEVQMVLLKGN